MSLAPRIVVGGIVGLSCTSVAWADSGGSGSELSLTALAIVSGTLLGIIFFFMSLNRMKAHRLAADLPTCKTGGVFIGLVELSGTAESEAPLVTPLTDARCVGYEYIVEERWSREEQETYTDEDGKQQTRTREVSGSATVDKGARLLDSFYLRDETGIIRIRPEGAKFEVKTTMNQTVTRSDPLYFGKGPAQEVSDSDHERTFREQAILLHAPLYVIGTARERDDIVAAEIAQAEGAEAFVISCYSEQERQESGDTVARVLLFVGWLGAVVASIGATGPGGLPAGAPVVVAVGYFALWGLGWVWMVFNGLVRLRQRVRQAWSQIDVQLKRRHDYIPRLVTMISAFADHERVVQTAVAELRAQLTATPPGQSGPDIDGVAPAVRAVVERYPALLAQEGFAKLHRELVDTEQRIELARSYYNEIATHFATRLQTVPHGWIGRLGGMRPEPLLVAEHFERAPVSVALAA